MRFTLGHKPPRPYATVVLASALKYDPFELRVWNCARVAGKSPNYSVSRSLGGGRGRLLNVRTGFVEQADFERLTAGTSELWLRTFLELVELDFTTLYIKFHN